MTKRDRIVVLVTVVVVGMAAFFMLALKPQREEASRLAQQVGAAQERRDAARTALAAGQAARVTYSANYSTVARLGKAVPTDDDIPSLVYQLDSTAASTGVDFRSVKLTSDGAGAATAAQTSGQAAATNSDQNAKGAAPSTGTASAPAAPTQSAAAALPPGAVVGPAGLSKMPFSFSFEGDFFRLSRFLTRIERYIKPARQDVDVRGRLLLVDGISLTAAQGGFPTMKATIAASAYLLPASQGLFDGASPQGPSVATTAPVSSGSSTPTTPSAAVTP